MPPESSETKKRRSDFTRKIVAKLRATLGIAVQSKEHHVKRKRTL
jgi:hypothetical protein